MVAHVGFGHIIYSVNSRAPARVAVSLDTAASCARVAELIEGGSTSRARRVKVMRLMCGTACERDQYSLLEARRMVKERKHSVKT